MEFIRKELYLGDLNVPSEILGQITIPYGLVARIPGFHPGGSGSIPGMGILSF